MITDDRMAEIVLANKYSSDPLAIYRAIEAEVHEELRKQEPVAYTFKQEGSPAYTNNPSFMKLNTQYVYEPLYAAPIPPVTPSQQEELRKQEPVAWMACSGSGTTVLPDERMNKDYYNIPLYAAPIPTPSQQEPVPKGFIVVSKDLLAEAIACNTDASLAEARHIINSVLKVSDDEIFREVLKEVTK